jgi:hypothetical protein
MARVAGVNIPDKKKTLQPQKKRLTESSIKWENFLR